MQVIPVSSLSNQTLKVTLAGQNCQINIRTLSTGLYLDLLISGSYIVSSVLCHDRCKIVRHTYLGFIGDLSFLDTQGLNDPVYTGLGTRYQLIYLELSDL